MLVKTSIVGWSILPYLSCWFTEATQLGFAVTFTIAHYYRQQSHHGWSCIIMAMLLCFWPWLVWLSDSSSIHGAFLWPRKIVSCPDSQTPSFLHKCVKKYWPGQDVYVRFMFSHKHIEIHLYAFMWLSVGTHYSIFFYGFIAADVWYTVLLKSILANRSAVICKKKK